MIRFLEFTEVYDRLQSLETTCKELDAITNAPFLSSKYQTFGRRTSSNPPSFLFMNKWYLTSRPFYAEILTTKMIITVHETERGSQLIVTTKTNPMFIAVFLGLIATFLFIRFFPVVNFTINAALSIIVFIAFSYAIDRFLKQQLFVSLENDLKLKPNKK